MTKLSNVPESVATVIRARLADRRNYTRVVDWWASIYNRVLMRVPDIGLFRGAIRGVYLASLHECFYIRLGTSDWWVLEEIFFEHEYQIVAAALRGERGIVIDLGANIGASIRLWQELAPGTVVVGVEPDPDNFRVCMMNVAAGPSPENVILVQGAVGSRAGFARLDTSNGAWATKSIPTSGSGDVQVYSIEDVLSRVDALVPITLVKCDIEGGEVDLFSDKLQWLHRVRNIAIEVHGMSYVAAIIKGIEGEVEFDSVLCKNKGDVSVLYILGMRPRQQ